MFNKHRPFDGEAGAFYVRSCFPPPESNLLFDQLMQARGGKSADGAVQDVLRGDGPAAGSHGDHHAQHG